MKTHRLKPSERAPGSRGIISPDANVERVRLKLLDRSRIGLKKYGVSTAEAGLSRNEWLAHLQCELLDAAVYIEAALRPRKEHDDG